MTRSGVGIDVSRDWLDVARSDEAHTERFRNSDSGVRSLIGWLGGCDVHRVVLEASGGYELTALVGLHRHGLEVVLIQPIRARHFARAIGENAKTDAIDARVLARMAVTAVDDTPLWEPPEESLADLKALVDRRQQLVMQRDAEKKRLRQAREIVREEISDAVDSLKARIRLLERQIDDLVAEVPQLREEIAVLERVRGLGRISAATLRVTLPELGRLTRTQIAALVGVAPMNKDSGQKTGRRYCRGGRDSARQSLYMATLAATRWNEVIAARYRHLVSGGKKPKVALVACMRKLLIHLNSLMRAHIQGARRI